MPTAQILSAGTTAGPSNSLTEYAGLEGRSVWASAEADAQWICASAGTLSHLRVEMASAPAAGKSFAFTVMVNGVASALTCTVADANTSAEDITHTAAIAAGDRISLRSVPTGTPTSSRLRVATQFAHTTALTAIAATVAEAPSNAATRYTPFGPTDAGFGPGDGFSWSDTESASRANWSIEATIKSLYISLAAAPGAGNSIAFTIMKNGVADAASTVTISETDTSGSVTGLTIDVTAGDQFSLRSVPTSSPTVGVVRAGVAYTPDTEHQWNVLFVQYNGSEPPNNSFHFMSPGEQAWTTTEANHLQLGGAATGSKSYTAKSLRAWLDAAPGAGTSRTFTLRVNQADSALAVTVNDAETTDVAASDVTIASGDEIGYKHAESGAAANPIVIRLALLVEGQGAATFTPPGNSGNAPGRGRGNPNPGGGGGQGGGGGGGGGTGGGQGNPLNKGFLGTRRRQR